MVRSERQIDAADINRTLLHLSTQNLTRHLVDFATRQDISDFAARPQPWVTNLFWKVRRSVDSLNALICDSDHAEIRGAQPARRYRGSSLP